MSAPETNIEKQTRRHRPALTGIVGVLLFAGLIFAGFSLFGPGTEEDSLIVPPAIEEAENS